MWCVLLSEFPVELRSKDSRGRLSPHVLGGYSLGRLSPHRYQHLTAEAAVATYMDRGGRCEL